MVAGIVLTLLQIFSQKSAGVLDWMVCHIAHVITRNVVYINICN